MLANSGADAEISLSDLFRRLWQWRGVIVLVPLLIAGMAALTVVFSALGESRQATYLVSLKSIENQRYPNGSEFSPRDLLIPEVLSEVRRLYDISSDINLNDAISVSYDSPLAEGIAKSYQQRLSARNLTQAEIEALNQNYLRELNSAMRSSIRITADYPALGLDSARGMALIADLPRIWNSIYTTQYRIFSDRGLADLAVTRTEENLTTTASILTVNNRLRAMMRGVNTFLDDNRLAMLRTPDGIAPADLIIDLRNFQEVYFNILKTVAFKTNDLAAQAYLSRIKLDIQEKTRQIKAHDDTLSSLGEYQRSARSDASIPVALPQIDNNSSVQIGDTALTGIIDLAEQGSYANLVRRVLDDRRVLMIELAALERELEVATTSGQDITISPRFVSEAAEVLKDLTNQYSEMLRTAVDQLRLRSGELYEPLLGPRLSSSPLFSQRSAMIIGAAGLAGLLLSVVVVFAIGSPRRSGHLVYSETR